MTLLNVSDKRTNIEVMIDQLDSDTTVESGKESCVEIYSVHESEAIVTHNDESELVVVTGWRWSVLVFR